MAKPNVVGTGSRLLGITEGIMGHDPVAMACTAGAAYAGLVPRTCGDLPRLTGARLIPKGRVWHEFRHEHAVTTCSSVVYTLPELTDELYSARRVFW